MIQYRTNADKVAKELQGIAREFPREFRQAFATLSRGLKTRIGEVVRTGRSAKLGVSLPFAPLNPLTVAIQKRRTFGGRMSKSISSYIDTNGMKVQLPAGLSKYGTAFQVTELRQWNRKDRAKLYAIARSQLLRAQQAFVSDAVAGKSVRISDNSLSREERELPIVDDILRRGAYSRPARPIFAPIVAARGFRNYCLDVVRKRIAAIIEKRAKRR